VKVEPQVIERQMKCRGLNFNVSLEGKRVIVSRVVPLTTISIPLSRIKAVELVVSSIFPPILVSLASLTLLVGMWWFAGGLSWPVTLPQPYRSLSSWAVLAIALGLGGAGYAWVFAKISIMTIDNQREITVWMVPRRSGERFVNSLRTRMRRIEE